MSNDLQPLPGIGSTTLGLPGDSNVLDELGRAGASLGSLVELTGNSVAKTQNELTARSAATATTLANTLVDVIAVQESIYDDQGTLTDGKTYVRKLPLINFVDPVFYEWTQVRLQGQFFAKEIATSSKHTSKLETSSGASGSATFFIFLGGVNGGFHGGAGTERERETNTRTETDSTSDISLGRMRMYAQLNPKRDIGVPKPRQIVQGPSLNIILGEIVEVKDNDQKTVGKEASAMIELRRRDGTPIAGKAISIETDGVAWSFDGGETTNAEGRVNIILRREFLGEEPDTSPINVIVTARLGLVTNSTTITF